MDIVSLARRFELPKDILRDINALGSNAEKIEALDQALSNMGITQELLTGQASTTAVTYDKLIGSFQDLFATIGTGLASALEPLAAKFIEIFTYARQGIETLNNMNSTLASFNATIAAGAPSYDAYKAKVEETNAAMREQYGLFSALAPQVRTLTPALYEVAAAYQAQGMTWDAAIAKASELETVWWQLQAAAVEANVHVDEGRAIYENFLAAGTQLSAVLGDNGAAALEWAAKVKAGTISAEDATNQMADLILTHQQRQAELQAETDAQAQANEETDKGAEAIARMSAELNENIQRKVEAKIESLMLADAEGQVNALAEAAASGLITASDAASQMASQFGIATSQAYALINAMAQLRLAEAARATNTSGIPYGYYQAATGSKDPIAFRQLQEARQAELDYQYAVGDTATKLELKQRELNNTTKGTVEYWRALTEVTQLERQLAAEAERAAKNGGGGGGTRGGKGGGKSAAEKQAERDKKANEKRVKEEEKLRDDLLDIQADYAEKMEDAEADHLERLADIYADYYEKQREAEKANEVGKRRNRADFYAGLDPADNEGIDVNAFAAQYEEAYAEAQRIAQEGNAKLAQEYLELRTQQIEEMKELEKQMADVRADKNLTDEQKKARLEYLEGLKKLYEDAQAEELKQLLEGGDEYKQELDQRLSEEEARYAEQTTKIAEEARKQADEKVKAAERSRESILKENEALQAQYDLLKNITATNGGKPVTATPPPPVTVPSTTAPMPVTTEPSGTPQPVTSTAEGMLVRQLEVWKSHDEILNGTLTAVGERLESRLVEVISAIDSSRDAIVRSLGAVESAVGRINNQSVVNR